MRIFDKIFKKKCVECGKLKRVRSYDDLMNGPAVDIFRLDYTRIAFRCSNCGAIVCSMCHLEKNKIVELIHPFAFISSAKYLKYPKSGQLVVKTG